jgi:hypothetical protein
MTEPLTTLPTKTPEEALNGTLKKEEGKPQLHAFTCQPVSGRFQ